jgi:hypothetical protein
MRRRIVFAALICGAIGIAAGFASAGRPAAHSQGIGPAVLQAPGGAVKLQAA